MDAPRRRPATGVAAKLAAVLLAAMVAGQIASGLRPGSLLLVDTVVLLLAGTAVAAAAATASVRSAVAAFGFAAAVGYAAEWVGVRTGLPFGEYRYTDVLTPQIADVPVIVAIAWAGMGLAAYAVAPGRGLVRIGAGAVALTAWDLFLDPQMLRLGAWVWAGDGWFRGVPLTNFAGWLLVSALLMAVIHALLGDRAAGAPALVRVYAVMAVMETVAFAAVFEPRDPAVAIVGGLAMGVFAVPALIRSHR